MRKLTKKDLKKINGGYIDEPGNDGRCQPGWFLCPTNICIDDDGGNNPIRPDSPNYGICFGR